MKKKSTTVKTRRKENKMYSVVIESFSGDNKLTLNLSRDSAVTLFDIIAASHQANVSILPVQFEEDEEDDETL